jgi:hypothetical protein
MRTDRKTPTATPATPARPSPVEEAPAAPRRRGRPRLSPEALGDRLAAYCARYGVSLNDTGLPPFPAGRRESAQHREWMALYKAHRRFVGPRPVSSDMARRQELLAAQRGRCPICEKPLELTDSQIDRSGADAPSADPWGSPPDVALHPDCRRLLELARAVGPEALDRAKQRL